MIGIKEMKEAVSKETASFYFSEERYGLIV